MARPAYSGFSRRSLHGQVVDDVGRRIMRGDLRPGDTLPNEQDMVRDLGVSRTVLREAMKVLGAKGLVETKTRTGSRVRPRTEWNLLDPDVLAWRHDQAPDPILLRNLIEVRRMIEPAAAALAATRAHDPDVRAIEEAYQAMQRALGDADRYITADLDFHDRLLAASGNELLNQLSHAIAAALRLSRKVTTLVPGSAAHSLPNHLAVLDAIKRNDPEEARSAMLELVDTAASDIAKVLPEAGAES
jgi:DNA-binding FadR family transcriptional regulator